MTTGFEKGNRHFLFRNGGFHTVKNWGHMIINILAMYFTYEWLRRYPV